MVSGFRVSLSLQLLQFSLLEGAVLKKMEDEKGIVARFVIRRSANQRDVLDRAIINANKDIILAPEEFPKKTKLFFAYAADHWDAKFYSKVNNDIHVNTGYPRSHPNRKLNSVGTTNSNDESSGYRNLQ